MRAFRKQHQHSVRLPGFAESPLLRDPAYMERVLEKHFAAEGFQRQPSELILDFAARAMDVAGSDLRRMLSGVATGEPFEKFNMTVPANPETFAIALFGLIVCLHAEQAAGKELL